MLNCANVDVKKKLNELATERETAIEDNRAENLVYVETERERRALWVETFRNTHSSVKADAALASFDKAFGVSEDADQLVVVVSGDVYIVQDEPFHKPAGFDVGLLGENYLRSWALGSGRV